MQALPEDRKIIEPAAFEVNALRRRIASFFSLQPLHYKLLLCFACAFVSVACADDETKAKRLEKKAVVAVDEERFDDAIAVYRNMIDLYPDTEAARSASDRITFLSGLSHSVESFDSRTARDLMVKTARAVQRYRWTRGRFPNTLDELMPKLLDESPIDPWGRPLGYERKRNGYRLVCLGADGQQGGDGESADFIVVNGEFRSDPTHEGPF